MAIEAYKKEQERLVKVENDKNGVVETKILTTEEILADKEKSSLFGSMLGKTGDPEDKKVAERLASHNLEQADFAVLEKHRSNFEQKMSQVESIKSELTPEMIIEIGRNNPEFQELIKHVKPENMSSVLKDQMANLSINDPAGFENLFKQVEISQSYKKGGMKLLDESVAKICADKNINEGEYIKVLAIQDKNERETALSEMVRSSWGGGKWGKIKRLFDSVTFGSVAGGSVDELSHQKGKIDASLRQLDANKKAVGAVLSSTLMDNGEMRKAFSEAILGEKTKKEQIGFKESQGIYSKEAQIDSDWEKLKKNPFTINNVKTTWDMMNDTQKKFERQKFVDNLSAESKKKTKAGFWGSICEAIFSAFLVDKTAKLKL